MDFKVFESKEIPLEQVLLFLQENYSSPNDSVQVIHNLDYLEWFCSNGGVLGVILQGEEWVALFLLGVFLVRYENCQLSVFNSGPLCVSKKNLFKGLSQRIVKETSSYIKEQYKMPILGAGVTGIQKPTLFSRFGMYLSSDVLPPKNPCFSSSNLFLCDDSSFLSKFENENGFVLYYNQEVMNNGQTEKWIILVSYYTVNCWKRMTYDFWCSVEKQCDRILVFENLERKDDDLTELGFEKFSSYNLYLDSPTHLPRFFLYYNLFLY